jgi:hypothetical protein
MLMTFSKLKIIFWTATSACFVQVPHYSPISLPMGRLSSHQLAEENVERCGLLVKALCYKPEGRGFDT